MDAFGRAKLRAKWRDRSASTKAPVLNPSQGVLIRDRPDKVDRKELECMRCEHLAPADELREVYLGYWLCGECRRWHERWKQ